MKYLVNRETKEHIHYHEDCSVPLPGWTVVDADDEGWIKWDGGECPLPPGNECEFVCENGRSVRTGVDDLEWRKGIEGFSDVTFYRPILPAESKPTLEETWHAIKRDSKVDVFTRLSAAVAASESIPALIAEINAMLPEVYEVREKVSEAQEIKFPTYQDNEPAEDMSDWRNWREGDVVVRDGIEARWWTQLGRYAVAREGTLTGVYDDDGEFRPFNGNNGGRFKFHSRPVTK